MTQASPETAPEVVETSANDAPEATTETTSSEVVSMENWRNEMSGGDEKVEKRLGRYNSITDVGKALIEAQDKIRRGEAKSLPENPSDEQVAKWREENGIPESWDKYDLGETQINDDMKSIVESLLQVAHQKNIKSEDVNDFIAPLLAAEENRIKAENESDELDRQDVENTMREAWKTDYQSNKNAIDNLLSTIPEDVRGLFISGRLANGKAILNDPGMLSFLADTARAINPAATVVPNVADPVAAIDDEIASLEKMMGNRQSEYWKGPKSERLQSRYRELLETKDKL